MNLSRNKAFIIAETGNYILWFAMDAFWMFDNLFVAQMIIAPCLILGLFSIFEKFDMKNICISLAVNCWLAMNIFWMLNFMFPAKLFFVFGILMLIISVILSNGTDILYKFKRFKQ